MYTEKRFTQMSVKKIATAKRTFRVTREHIKKLEHDLRYNSDDIDLMQSMIKQFDHTVNDKIESLNIFNIETFEFKRKYCFFRYDGVRKDHYR